MKPHLNKAPHTHTHTHTHTPAYKQCKYTAEGPEWRLGHTHITKCTNKHTHNTNLVSKPVVPNMDTTRLIISLCIYCEYLINLKIVLCYIFKYIKTE